jgi:hypothetical protein
MIWKHLEERIQDWEKQLAHEADPRRQSQLRRKIALAVTEIEAADLPPWQLSRRRRH